MSDTLAPKFPAVAYQLHVGDKGYDIGGRIQLEQLDGDVFVFKSKAAMDVFVGIHGYELISNKQMRRRRIDHDMMQHGKTSDQNDTGDDSDQSV